MLWVTWVEEDGVAVVITAVCKHTVARAPMNDA
jgi:hypothetical protein